MKNYFRQKKGSQLNETLIGYGAGSENRTRTLSPARDFESRASTSSAIPALVKTSLP